MPCPKVTVIITTIYMRLLNVIKVFATCANLNMMGVIVDKESHTFSIMRNYLRSHKNALNYFSETAS